MRARPSGALKDGKPFPYAHQHLLQLSRETSSNTFSCSLPTTINALLKLSIRLASTNNNLAWGIREGLRALSGRLKVNSDDTISLPISDGVQGFIPVDGFTSCDSRGYAYDDVSEFLLQRTSFPVCTSRSVQIGGLKVTQLIPSSCKHTSLQSLQENWQHVTRAHRH